MPFMCNLCSLVIDTSCGIGEHVATKHSGLSLWGCFHCHDTGHELYFQNYENLAKHSATKHINQKCEAIYVRSVEAFISKHINEIEQNQTSHKDVSLPVAKQEVIADVKNETSCCPIQEKDGRVDVIDLTGDDVDLEVIPVAQSCVEDRTDNTTQTCDNAVVRENNKSIVEPVSFQSINQLVAAVPVNSIIPENRNVVECASVVVKTETSPHLACGQVIPDNQEYMQDPVNMIETLPDGQGTMIDRSMTNNQSSVAPAMEMPPSVVSPSCNDFASVQSEVNILSVNLSGAQLNGFNENVAAVPVETVIRNDVDDVSVTVKTETSPLACEQVPSDNQVSMQDQMDTGEMFPIEHNGETVINQSNADNQSNVAPVMEMPSSIVSPPSNDLASVQNETNSEMNILSVKMKKGKKKLNPIIIKEEVPTSPKLNVPKKVQKRAQRRVTSKKRFPCSVCSKTFSRPYTALEHKRVIHDHGEKRKSKKRRYPCSVCSKTFPCLLRVREHKRVIHDHGEKHKCDQCGKSYYYKSDYQTHIRRHKEGMLICDDCGKYETGFHKSLQNHIVIKHLQIRPYKCKLCNKTFGWKSHMKKHLHVVHLKEKPFICDYCDIAMGEKQSLYKHWTRKHYKK